MATAAVDGDRFLSRSKTSSPRRRRRRSPVAWAHDCIDWERAGTGLTPYQEEVLEELPARRRVAVRGPHGLGKTALSSIGVLWFADTRDGEDWKIPTTASAWRQLDHYLWPEIHKWARLVDWSKAGRAPLSERTELLALKLQLRTGEAWAAATDDASSIEGAHADHLLYLFDEAKAISGDVFDAAEGAFSGAGSDTSAEAFALAVSTPGEPSGRFYDLHRRAPGTEDWWVRHVRLEECIAAGRVSREWAVQRAKQWGEGSAVYQNRVLGEFASSDEDGVIPLPWVEAANERWRVMCNAEGVWSQVDALSAVGVDVGGGGADPSVLALRFGAAVGPLRRLPKRDPLQTSSAVVAAVRPHGRAVAVIDVIGVGSGAIADLRHRRGELRGEGVDVTCEAFVAGGKTVRRDQAGEFGFADCRAAAWWNLRELLDPANKSLVALPPDDLLTGDLTAPHWWEVPGGKIRVESKDDIRKRLGRSTDSGDAVVQAFWPAQPRPGRGFGSAVAGWRLS